jgi:hypothetical protein
MDDITGDMEYNDYLSIHKNLLCSMNTAFGIY